MQKPTPFQTPNVAVDTVLFTIINNMLHVLLIQIGSGVFEHHWALPGGLVHIDETLDDAAVRVLFEKTHVKNLYLEQLKAFGALDRDPRSRTISIAYYALVSNADTDIVYKAEYYNDVKLFPVTELPAKVAFDHKEIIETARMALQERIMEPKTVAALLPKEFTLSQLQAIHEIILNEKLDKRNFRKKMQLLEIVKPTSKKSEGAAHRPALLYQFNKK